jgi:DNA invertase Pin-like site-specific DNA recombinase
MTAEMTAPEHAILDRQNSPSKPEGRIIGYGRVSTADQCLDVQREKLAAAGAEILYLEKASGKNTNRPQLQLMLADTAPGDNIVILKLDRLGRSAIDLHEIAQTIKAAGATLRSLNDHIDTRTAMGEFVFHIFAAMAQLERSMIIERTLLGLESARAKGRFGGRPKALTDRQREQIVEDSWVRHREVAELVRDYGVSESTIRRILSSALDQSLAK